MLSNRQNLNIGTSFFSGAGNVSFSLRNTTYQNNSHVTMEDIGVGDDSLLCVTDLAACCRPPFTGDAGSAKGNWYFPNRTRVLSAGENWDVYRTRGHSVVLLHRRRGGENGIYRCEIPDALGVIQTIYIEATTGEWLLASMYIV